MLLERKDLYITEFGGASVRRCGNFNRKLHERQYKISIEHHPTSICVSGLVPPGHYSKKEMRRLKEKLRGELMDLLRAKVARHARVRGR